MADDQGRELAWDSEIENDGSGWTLLPAGEYPFRVTGFKRARFEGSAKLPTCNIAVVTLDVGDADLSSSMEHRLFMHSKCEGFLCAFFKAIGQRQHGEKKQMDWSKVVGSTGRCKVAVRTWKGKDGADHESNEVKGFVDPAGAPNPAGAQTADGELPF
jgi:hypothetical protein